MRVSGFHVFKLKIIRVLIKQIQHGRADKDEIVEEKQRFCHVDQSQVFVDYLKLFKVGLRDQTFGLV